MAFNVNEFRSHLGSKKGPAKIANFEVNIALPPAVGDANNIRSLTLQCEATDLPGKSFITSDAKVYGPVYKVPYQVQYETVNFTFISSNDFSEKKIFDNWLNLIMSPSTYNLRFPKDSGYLTNVYITQFDDSGTKIYRVQLIDAFPSGMSAMNVSWASDTFHRLTVQFTFHKYEAIPL